MPAAPAVRGTLVAAIVLGAALAGCAGAPRQPVEQFTRLDGEHFRFVVTATMLHPLNGEQAEHERLDVLARRVAAGGLCPAGYTLTRRPALAYGRINADDYAVRDVTYGGECTR
jgi:hypothetical protein